MLLGSYGPQLAEQALQGAVLHTLKPEDLALPDSMGVQPSTITVQYLPASFTTFLYVLEGSLQVGDEAKEIHQHQVGWLDRHHVETLSELKLTSGVTGARVILYAGEPQGDAILSHGPFIGDTQEDIQRLYRAYRQGKLDHIATVEASQRILW